MPKLPDDFFDDNLFVVSKIEGWDVHLSGFKDILQGTKTVRDLILTGFLKQPHVGDDGIPVTFNLGDLVAVTPREDFEGTFHLANAIPSSIEGYENWLVVKEKIGIKRPEPTDGQFRHHGLRIVKER